MSQIYLGSSLLLTDTPQLQTPFRETHHISGRAVALAEKNGVQISDLSLEELKGLSSKFDTDVKDVFNFESSVEKRAAIGGTSKEMIGRQVGVLRNLLAAAKQQ